jgi:hypothetical protein
MSWRGTATFVQRPGGPIRAGCAVAVQPGENKNKLISQRRDRLEIRPKIDAADFRY